MAVMMVLQKAERLVASWAALSVAEKGAWLVGSWALYWVVWTVAQKADCLVDLMAAHSVRTQAVY